MKTVAAGLPAKLIISLLLAFAGTDTELTDAFSDMPQDAVNVWAVCDR